MSADAEVRRCTNERKRCKRSAEKRCREKVHSIAHAFHANAIPPLLCDDAAAMVGAEGDDVETQRARASRFVRRAAAAFACRPLFAAPAATASADPVLSPRNDAADCLLSAQRLNIFRRARPIRVQVSARQQCDFSR